MPALRSSRITSELIETRRFQIIFASMLLSIGVSIMSVGFGGPISYVTLGLKAALPSSIAMIAFMWANYQHYRRIHVTPFDRWLELASNVIIAWGIMGIFFLVLAALDTTIPQEPSSAIGVGFVIGTLLSFLLYEFSIASESPSTQQVVHYTMIGLISCMMVSVMIDGDNSWWTKHFSALGATTASSAPLFRIALTMTGVAFITIGYRLARSLKQSRLPAKYNIPRRLTLLLTLFYTAGVSSIVAALISYDYLYIVHDTAAKFVGLAMGLLILLATWIFPTLPKSFAAYSIMLAFASIIAWPYVQSLTLKLTYYEIVSTVGVLCWLSIFAHLVASSASYTASTESSVR